MKISKALTLAGAALIVVTSVNAWSQTSAPMAPTPAASAAGTSDMASPKTMKKEDRALAKKVRTALTKDKTINPSRIIVKAKGGTVWLEGTVPEEAQSDKATSVAQQVPGVTSVKNALSIKAEEGQ